MRLRVALEAAKACERNSGVMVSRRSAGSLVRVEQRLHFGEQLRIGARLECNEGCPIIARQLQRRREQRLHRFAKPESSRRRARRIPREFATQPRARHGPFALDARERNADNTRCLLERETPEVAQLDNAPLRLVELLKPGQRFVDGQHVHAFVVESVQRLALIHLVSRPRVVDAQTSGAIAAPLGIALSRIVHQHSSA